MAFAGNFREGVGILDALPLFGEPEFKAQIEFAPNLFNTNKIYVFSYEGLPEEYIGKAQIQVIHHYEDGNGNYFEFLPLKLEEKSGKISPSEQNYRNYLMRNEKLTYKLEAKIDIDGTDVFEDSIFSKEDRRKLWQDFELKLDLEWSDSRQKFYYVFKYDGFYEPDVSNNDEIKICASALNKEDFCYDITSKITEGSGTINSDDLWNTKFLKWIAGCGLSQSQIMRKDVELTVIIYTDHDAGPATENSVTSTIYIPNWSPPRNGHKMGETIDSISRSEDCYG